LDDGLRESTHGHEGFQFPQADLHLVVVVLAEDFRGRTGLGRVGVILSGGNVDFSDVQAWRRIAS
jgi:hypothetical protein